MTKLTNFIIILSICLLPVLVEIITDIGFALFVAPLIFAVASFVSAIIWFSLIPFKITDKVKHIFLITLMIPFSVYIGLMNYHNYTPEGCFKRLLLSPIPNSVNFIDYHGFTAMSGGYEVLVFTLSPDHLELILKTENFKPIDLKDVRADSQYSKKIKVAKEYGITTSYMYRTGEESYLLLLVNESKNKAFLYRFRL